ncbi:50S ribosomal protein L21e [archaeon]
MQKSKGKMRGTRGLRKGHREKGMQPVNQYLQKFAVGDSVHISIVASEPKGMPFPRFNGRTGVVQGKQGDAYQVKIKDGDKDKLLMIRPVHLKKA